MCRLQHRNTASYSCAFAIGALIAVLGVAPATAHADDKDQASLEERLKALEKKDAERDAKDAKAAADNAAATKATTPETEGPAPFAFGDFSWSPANYGASEHPYSFGPFSGELRAA